MAGRAREEVDPSCRCLRCLPYRLGGRRRNPTFRRTYMEYAHQTCSTESVCELARDAALLDVLRTVLRPTVVRHDERDGCVDVVVRRHCVLVNTPLHEKPHGSWCWKMMDESAGPQS